MEGISLERRKFRLPISMVGLILFNVLLFIGLSILSPTFLTLRNMRSLMVRMSELAMLTFAQTLVLINGGMDLTVGSAMALSGTIAGMLFKVGAHPVIAVLGALVTGIVIGTLNGFLVVHLKIDSFIATVATNSILRSVVYLLLRGRVLSGFPKNYVLLGSVNLLGIPLLFVLVIVFAIILHFFLRKTALGRSVYAVGANINCAHISGIDTNFVKYFVFVASGLLSAIGGVFYTIRIGAMIPDAGLNSPLEVVTAALIGGASVKGKGSIFGSLLGILAMYVLINGFNLLGFNPFWEVVLLGIVLITIVGQSSMKKVVKMSRASRRGRAA